MVEIVQSVDRALSILEMLSDYSEGLGIKDISEKVELHKSTVHRLLRTLIVKGFVEQDDTSNKYRISLKMFELGYKRIENIDIVGASKPHIENLMKSVNEVVHLVVRDKNKIVYIDKVEADNTIRMASTIGRRSPLYCTSVGKAILAYMSEEEMEEIWNKSNVKKLTKNTITDLNEFKKELHEIRNQGYAEDDEENELGVRCIGVPIFNRLGKVEGAISVSGPTTRITKKKLHALSNEVKKYGALISKELGYRGQD